MSDRPSDPPPRTGGTLRLPPGLTTDERRRCPGCGEMYRYVDDVEGLKLYGCHRCRPWDRPGGRAGEGNA